MVPAEGKYQVQMAKHRKEQLYHDAITLLDQGKVIDTGSGTFHSKGGVLYLIYLERYDTLGLVISIRKVRSLIY